MTVDTKSAFYELFLRGATGNCLRNWSYPDYLKSDFSGGVAVRLRNRASSLMKYDLPGPAAVARYVRRLEQQHGISPDQVIVSELAPDDDLILQFEAMRCERYLYLRWNDTPGLRMRQAMENHCRHCWGLEAVERVRQALDAKSWNWLQELFDRYPDSIVEATAYRHGLGIYGWNTLFWEIRNY
ncbi:MAG: hypothetical protein J7M38_02520 [Armatimonadetes bacterium]|nr:hypothetical protein [Armatimonadota bacterium]